MVLRLKLNNINQYTVNLNKSVSKKRLMAGDATNHLFIPNMKI